MCWIVSGSADDLSSLINADLGNADLMPEYSRQSVADVERLYALRNFLPAWNDEDAATALRILKQSADEGLNPGKYRIDPAERPSDDQEAVRWDIRLSEKFLEYARDVHTGRLPPGAVYGDVDLPVHPFDAPAELNEALSSGSLATFATILPPQRPEYEFLRGALARYRSSGSVIARTRVAQIVANMERWRWLPDRPDGRFVEVNVADASLKVVDNGLTVVTSRVVVGRPNWMTPLLATRIVAVVLNPAWNIPGVIADREILPKIERHPGYLAAHRMVLHNGAIQQMPGSGSALGAFLMQMPNRFDVYLHDTPSRRLFALTDRFLSHGCVRVEKIAELAAFALAGDPAADISSWAPPERTETRSVSLSQELPVYILYWTVFENPDGSIAFRHDVYGRDSRLLTRLGMAGLSNSIGRSPDDSVAQAREVAIPRATMSVPETEDAAEVYTPGASKMRKRGFDLRPLLTVRSEEPVPTQSPPDSN